MKAAERESGKVVSGAGEICGVDWLWVLPLTAALIALAVIFHPLSVNLADHSFEWLNQRKSGCFRSFAVGLVGLEGKGTTQKLARST